MRAFSLMCLAPVVLVAAGCSTTQDITLGKSNHDKSIQSVAQVLDDGNSSQMNDSLAAALQKQGLAVRPTLPQGTSTSREADILVSYVDVWRWDLAMYLKSLTIKITDATNGDLLAIGRWNDSPMHGFRDSKMVMDTLVEDTLTKVRSLRRNPGNQ